MVSEPTVQTVPFSWGGFAVGFVPQASLWAYLLLTVSRVDVSERPNATYVGFPAISGVLIFLIIGFGLLTDRRTKPFGKGLLTGLAIGAWLFFLTCGVIATDTPRQ